MPAIKLDPDTAPADDVSKGERVSLVGFGTFERKRRNGRIALMRRISPTGDSGRRADPGTRETRDAAAASTCVS